jgi:uncharacterized membrane protein
MNDVLNTRELGLRIEFLSYEINNLMKKLDKLTQKRHIISLSDELFLILMIDCFIFIENSWNKTDKILISTALSTKPIFHIMID